MSMLMRVLLAAGLSWFYAVTLGLLFAACSSGHFSLATLRLPGVIPVVLVVSTVIAVVVTPIAVWSMKTGPKNLWIYGPILWATLAIYEVLIVPRTGAYGFYGLVLLGIIGLVILGLIPPS